LFIGMQVRHGSLWKPRLLAVAASLWACSDLSTLKERFHHARKIVNRIFRWKKPAGETRQGFIKMLCECLDELMLAIVVHLRQQMEENLSGHWTIGGYTVFARDGSRIEMARTRRIERAYSAKKKRKKRTGMNRGRAKTSAKKRTQSAASVKKNANTPQMWRQLVHREYSETESERRSGTDPTKQHLPFSGAESRRRSRTRNHFSAHLR
jgi:hypothetical protein